MQKSLRRKFINLLHPRFKKQFAFLMGLLIISPFAFSQLAIDTAASAEQLAKSIVDASFNVSNIKLKCAKSAVAKFTSTSTLGFEKGIILTTGLATNAIGPNNNVRASYNNGTPGDAQLDSVLGAPTFDGCALEFDFVPTCDRFKMRYVFGSEEYPAYISGGTFADFFAFFISGPGIKGNRNIALNAKDGGSDYFIDNANGTALQYNGYTKPLTAALNVTSSSTYHLKIVIADVNDGSYDSGVFIEDGSMQCATVGINTIPLNAAIQIYPNPASEVIYVNTPQNNNKTMNVHIYSVVGKVVYQETYLSTTQPHQINTSNIEANGIYFIKLESGNETVTRKININH